MTSTFELLREGKLKEALEMASSAMPSFLSSDRPEEMEEESKMTTPKSKPSQESGEFDAITKKVAEIEKAKVKERLDQIQHEEKKALSTGLQNNKHVKNNFMHHDASHVACRSKAHGPLNGAHG